MPLKFNNADVEFTFPNKKLFAFFVLNQFSKQRGKALDRRVCQWAEGNTPKAPQVFQLTHCAMSGCGLGRAKTQKLEARRE